LEVVLANEPELTLYKVYLSTVSTDANLFRHMENDNISVGKLDINKIPTGIPMFCRLSLPTELELTLYTVDQYPFYRFNRWKAFSTCGKNLISVGKLYINEIPTGMPRFWRLSFSTELELTLFTVDQYPFYRFHRRKAFSAYGKRLYLRGQVTYRRNCNRNT
jgi:hypothetical protein